MFFKRKPEKEPSEREYDKHSIFHAWKWYIFFYEISLVAETLVSLFFWLLLYEDMMKDPIYETDFILYFELILNHVLILFLLVDYFCNSVPILRRHMRFMVYFGMFYVTLNFCFTKISGKPVYGVMSWDSLFSIIIASVSVFASFLIFFFYEWVSSKLLRIYATKKYQHKIIYEICTGRQH